jgi:hypothetical protein
MILGFLSVVSGMLTLIKSSSQSEGSQTTEEEVESKPSILKKNSVIDLYMLIMCTVFTIFHLSTYISYSAAARRLASQVHRGSALPTTPACGRVPSPLSKIWNPSSSFEWQSATLQLPRGLPPKVHRSPVLSTVPDSGRAPTPLSESRNARFPIERWKAVTCYLVGSARMPASPRCTEAQHFPLHLPAGESCLSCGRA